MQKASIGIRVHSGWAAVVTVGGSPPDIQVLDRRRAEICDPAMKGAKQPYHFVEGMDLAQAQEHLHLCAESSERLTTAALRDLTERYRIQCVSILLASGRPLPALPAILASHALIHTAEGEFFRRSFQRACVDLDLKFKGVRERELADLTPSAWRRRIAEIGKEIGPPWTLDQKLAAMAACLTLSNEVQKSTTSQSRVR